MESTPDRNRKKQKADVLPNNKVGTMKSGGMDPEQAAYIARFADVVNRYCGFMEQSPLPEKRAFVIYTAGLLTELYGAVLPLLPLLLSAETISTETSLDRLGLQEQTAQVRRRIADTLAEQSLYWEVFDPYIEDEPLIGSLDDNLADIYSDLKEGLLLSSGMSAAYIEEAAWEWRFGFLTHWGDHLTDALRALHRVLCALHND